eukprot:scaffold7139_cov115-Cylindrotheca_fusiformis.AAC.4
MLRAGSSIPYIVVARRKLVRIHNLAISQNGAGELLYVRSDLDTPHPKNFEPCQSNRARAMRSVLYSGNVAALFRIR